MADPRSLPDLEERLEPEVTLFHEGEPSGDLIILLSGRLGVYRGDHRVAEIDTPGAYVGESSALTQHPRTATVRTETPVRLLRVPRAKVPAFLRAAPDVAMKLATSLADRLRETTDHLVEAMERRETVERDLDDLIKALSALYGSLRASGNPEQAYLDALNGLRPLLNRHAARLHGSAERTPPLRG
jgi:CRP-like cAMP-binding protein